MTGSPTGLPTHRDTGPDERNAPPPTPHRSTTTDPSPPPTACAERRRRQGPPAATRSGSARALTPTPTRRAHNPAEKHEERSAAPLDRPRSFRDDLQLYEPPPGIEPGTYALRGTARTPPAIYQHDTTKMEQGALPHLGERGPSCHRSCHSPTICALPTGRHLSSKHLLWSGAMRLVQHTRPALRASRRLVVAWTDSPQADPWRPVDHTMCPGLMARSNCDRRREGRAMMENAIVVQDLRKRFGEVTASTGSTSRSSGTCSGCWGRTAPASPPRFGCWPWCSTRRRPCRGPRP